MLRYINLFIIGCLAALLAGCASTQTQSTFPSATGVIISMQPVTQSGGGKIGTLAGAAAGGYGGSTLTHNKKAQIADAAAGAVIGAVIGDIAEHAITNKHVMQYIVKTDNGTVITVEQPANPALQINQRVVVIYQNDKPQLIPDNSAPPRYEVRHYHYHHHHHYDDDDDDDD